MWRGSGVRTGGLVLALAGLLTAGDLQAQWPLWLNRGAAEKPVFPEILVDPGWLKQHEHDPDLVILDARGPGTTLERIPGSRSIDPFSLPAEPAVLAGRFGALGLTGRETVVLYADARSRAATGQLLCLLELAGHDRVRILNGGVEAWRRAGHATTGSLRLPGPPARFSARSDTSRLADYAYVQSRFGRAGTTIMDWRSPAMWDAGHIPHSLTFPLADLLNDSGTWSEGNDLRLVFQSWGPRDREFVDLDDELIVCGGFGAADVSIHPYLAARLAGIRRVRFYPGGFDDWRRHADAPVTRIVDTDFVRHLLHPVTKDPMPDRPRADIVLLDLRGEREYDTDHLPGAVWLPPHRFEAAIDSVLRARWPGIDRTVTPVLVYCYGPGCTRSRNVTTMAAHHGFRRLYWYRDGVVPWKLAGEPVYGRGH